MKQTDTTGTSPDAEHVVLEGVLLPVGWGASGEIEEIGLMTFDEHEYRIAPAAARLSGIRGLVRRRVHLSAILENGRLIRILDIRPIGKNETPADTGDPASAFGSESKWEEKR